MFVFTHDSTKCERCFDCVTSCPRGVFEAADPFPKVVHPEECIGKACGVCLAVCRAGGIHIAEVPIPYGRSLQLVLD